MKLFFFVLLGVRLSFFTCVVNYLKGEKNVNAFSKKKPEILFINTFSSSKLSTVTSGLP